MDKWCERKREQLARKCLSSSVKAGILYAYAMLISGSIRHGRLDQVWPGKSSPK